ncbi:MAG: hypothetical protein WCI22_17470 [Actinomycetota bacterium]
MVFVCGIAGLIISSVRGNNAGFVLSIGLLIVFAAIALLTYGAVTPKGRIDVFDEATAEQLEAQVAALIATGAPEAEVRQLVRDAMTLGRR